MKTTIPMQFSGFYGSQEPGWPLTLAAVWVGDKRPYTIIAWVLGLGADEDIPFTLLPRLYVLQRDIASDPHWVGGQVWLSWLGVVGGVRWCALMDDPVSP